MKNQLLLVLSIIGILVIISLMMMYPPKPSQTVVEVSVPPVHTASLSETLDLPPEYRPPPIQKYYRPQAPAQIGLLKSEDGDVRPIYGKQTLGHRDRFQYWSTTSDGHNNFSVPVTLDGRDCTEDLGCQEMYGNENVVLWDNPEVQYKSHIYRHDLFF